MKNYQVSEFANFFLIGVNHNQAPVEVREGFSLSEEQISHLIHDYKQEGGDGMMVLSTCNRTEIYAFADCPRQLISLFCQHAGQPVESFEKYQCIHQNREAIQHLFRVGSGLESKILGDFEIIGQIKKSFQFAKDLDAHNAFLNRLINNAVQCSKKVKNQTALSTGAASVAFAAVLQVKKYLAHNAQPKVLLLGMGKIGRTTCENLVNQTGVRDITLINRTQEKAERLAERYGVKHLELEHLDEGVNQADILIVATGATEPTVHASMFKTTKKRLILDLSMPRNVEHSLYQDPHFEVIDVDHLSDVAQESIDKRRAQVPLAESLIDEMVDEFYQWLESRRVAPTLQALRQKMENWKSKELQKLNKNYPEVHSEQAEALASQILNRITGQMARQLKSGGDVQRDLLTLNHIFELEKQ